MANVDYGQVRNEKIWVTKETTFNTAALPVPTDAIICRGRATLPSVLTDRVPSEEVRPQAPDIDQLIDRKKPPGEFELPCYAKAPFDDTRLPQWHVLLENVMGAFSQSAGQVQYTLVTDILEKSLTITYLADNVLHTYRGCHVSSVAWEVSGSDEGTMRFRGFLGNEVLAGYHTLAVAVPGTGATGDPVTLTMAESVCLLIGPRVDDTVNLKIGTEIFKVVGPIDYTAKTVPCLRGQAGSTVAAHAISDPVEPSIPGPDPDPNDTIIPMTLGTFALDGVVFRVTDCTITSDEHLEARMDEWGESALTGYRRPLTGRSVDVDFTAYQRRSIVALLTLAELGRQSELLVTIGLPDTVPQIELRLPRFQIIRPETGESGGEFTQHFTGQGLASSTPGNDGLDVTVKAAVAP